MMSTFASARRSTVLRASSGVTALMIKRLNDRDRPRYLAYLFWIPTVLSVLAAFAGPPQGAIESILDLLDVAVGIWAR